LQTESERSQGQDGRIGELKAMLASLKETMGKFNVLRDAYSKAVNVQELRSAGEAFQAVLTRLSMQAAGLG
jgi:hypothetical protein